ncbi:uncharacterized protein LOC127838584 [Dreissena polymorpha]|uniref:Uncharacterized protein n=1 Tax=Dreissena polymorpha TaxID=45954 RepID=A0A9D4FF57_DREPO|nr:uncharacterized protein LOC127838584 [Dreissena polymorpha]XP_052222371.1 uncharacterized protein LOC127838584 [Dreissena polymorpha]XP_052222372.1 uncharacterized protein LOC127838584 [Dreissena polymorpha]KAH3795476.1 hypothetical protein DPMN_149030 [Dreissena polymorpha]
MNDKIVNEEVQPACLPDESIPYNLTGLRCHVSGWAFDHGIAMVPLGDEATIIEAALCVNFYKCAAELEHGVNNCKRDSAGSLVCNIGGLFYLIGAASFGNKCGEKGHPGVYTRVTAMLPWITTMQRCMSPDKICNHVKDCPGNEDEKGCGLKEGQWVSKVIKYSSQYNTGSWSAQQILGVPDVYPTYGDLNGAWASHDIDANQYLEFQFVTPVLVTKVDVYETYNAGGVKAIKCLDVSGTWITLWSTPQVSVIHSVRIFSPSFMSTIPCFSNQIRLDIDCSVANSWVEIDAVGLHGSHGIPACEFKPCQNGGTCDDTQAGGYQCNCQVGWRGLHCETSLTEGQWVSKVIKYSSQYNTGTWSAQQILSVPDVYPTYWDLNGAWASHDIDANQYLEFQFVTPVHVTKVDVYETYNAGGVKAIKCLDVSGTWITLWSTPQVSVIHSARIFSPSFTSTTPCFSNQIRLDIDCSVANSWVEIDAVRLHGSQGIPACESKPCQNGGTCDETQAGGYQCNCQVGWRGLKCETRQDD